MILTLICKKLTGNNPHVVIITLDLLNCCVSNCSNDFHLLVCSRDMENTINHIVKNAEPTIKAKLMSYLKKWSEEEFKDKSNLRLIPSLYNRLKSSGLEAPITLEKSSSHYSDQSARREEEEFEQAIQLSLKESGPAKYAANSDSNQMYPSINKMNISDFSTNGFSSSICASNDLKEPYKVRALYDFEASEKDEITLKAGEILLVLNDRYHFECSFFVLLQRFLNSNFDFLLEK